MNLTQILKEIYLNNDCGCGCGGCKLTPTLTESQTAISENLQYHINEGIMLSENEFRIGSEAYMELFNEARSLYKEGKLQVGSLDKALLETNLGEFGLYEGENVPLDLPMVEAEYQGKGSRFNNLKDIEIALNHLIPGTNFERGSEYYNIEVGPEGYIAFQPKNSKNHGIISYKTSPYGDNNVGVLWINGNPHKGYEFTDIEQLYNLLKKFKVVTEAEYRGRDVQLNKPKRGGSKAYYVYVRDPKTKKVKKVSFGSGGLRAKIKNKDARNAFAKRHNCDQKKDRTKAGYWSCRLPYYAKQLGLGSNMNTFW